MSILPGLVNAESNKSILFVAPITKIPSDEDGQSCDVYCGKGTNYHCKGKCSRCVPAGHASYPYKPGCDWICIWYLVELTHL